MSPSGDELMMGKGLGSSQSMPFLNRDLRADYRQIMPPPQMYEGSSANTRFIGRMMHAQDMFNRVDNTMHEALRFDDIYGKCDTDLKRIQQDIDDYVRKWPPCTFIDKFKGPFHLYPW